jgi:hypothetical protein
VKTGGKGLAGESNKPSIVFYSGHRIISANSKEALENILRGIGRAVIITRAKSVGFSDLSGLQSDRER